MNLRLDKLRVLDFDLEHRPLNWVGQDFVWGEITAVAWKLDGEKYQVRLLGVPCQHFGIYVDAERCGAYHLGLPADEMLADFLTAYEKADLVTGHYIRPHDLPSVNGALLELGLSPLPARLTSDTYLDLGSRKNLGASQANLSEVLHVRRAKSYMSQAKWRSANRMTPEGMAAARRRALGDVRQHIALRAKLLELGWLGPPRLWSPVR